MKRLKYFTLAALVAFAACGEDETPPVVETITGTISGVVTIEGVGQSGVSVALSSGATATTDGSGAYSFANVEAGAYTVTISGFASDATFASTSKAATISTDGQVVQVNFDGSFVRTSAILGAVSAGGPLSGVTVSIGSSSTQTDANGQYSFSGLRAGTYTVSISGFDASMYIFASTSQTVTLGVGESQVVSFSGQLATTAQIVGSMYLDEMPKNDNFDAAEDAYMVAGVPIELEIAPGNTVTVETDANGAYAFTGLAAGAYKVSIDHSGIPAEVSLGTQASAVVTVTVGTTGEVNFGFDIIQQTLMVHAFLGRDGANAREFPVEGVEACLFGDQQLNDLLEDGNGDHCQTTDETGVATFVFDRADDTSPVGGTDHIVFATFGDNSADGAAKPAPADHQFDEGANEWQNGVMEIAYGASDIHAMAPDEIDVLATVIAFSFLGVESDGDALDADWGGELFSGDLAAPAFEDYDVPDDPDVDGLFELDAGNGWAADEDPVTYFVRLDVTANPGANEHAWMQVPTGDQGTVPAEDDDATGLDETVIMTFEWDGANVPVGTVIAMGTETVTYMDTDVTVAAHHEKDDMGDVPTFTFDGEDDDDDLAAIDDAHVILEICPVAGDGTIDDADCWTPNAAGATAGHGDAAHDASEGANYWIFPNVPVTYEFADESTTSTYHVRAEGDNNRIILQPDDVAFTLDGSDQGVASYPLDGGDDGDESSFAMKSASTEIEGTIEAADGTPAEGIIVTITATADNIQGSVAMPDADPPFYMTDTTDAAGFYRIVDLVEGPYNVMADVGDLTWTFKETLDAPAAGTEDNTDAMSGDRDLEGHNDVGVANFLAVWTAGVITGQVANDRDGDGTTIDPGEALAGAEMGLYTDTPDPDDSELVATATTDAEGIYEFAGVHEGDYIVTWMADTPDATVTALQALGDIEFLVTITAGDYEFGDLADNLPAWDYDLTEAVNVGAAQGDASFTDYSFLYRNTTVRGTASLGGGDAVEGMTVSARRCDDSIGAMSPAPARDFGGDGLPGGGDDVVACADFLGTTMTVTTNASGVFEFTGLTEGVYEVIPAPTTAPGGTYNTSTPEARLYLTVGNGDIESATFTIS
jgi:hypothetical protein